MNEIIPSKARPECACGCGERVKDPRSLFVLGHRDRVAVAPVRVCACGCGEPVTKRTNLYLKGHNRRLDESTLPFCSCGCGTRLKHHFQRWVRGHSSRKYCACGCGGIAPPHHQFIQNHHKTKERPLCACGCGEHVSGPSRRYLKGHSTRHRNNGTFGPTLHEQLVQIALQKIGRAFLFNIPIEHQYRPDFRFPEALLIIEIDGETHRIDFWKAHDEQREAFLVSSGYQIIHWTNEQVEADLPSLVAEFERIYQLRLFSCQGSVKPVSADEPRVLVSTDSLPKEVASVLS